MHTCKVEQSVTHLDLLRGFKENKVPTFHGKGTGWCYGCQLYAPAAFTTGNKPDTHTC